MGEVKGQWTGITLTGEWNLNINQGDLEGGAGSNLRSTYTSNQDQVTIEFFALYFSGGWHTWNWAVDIHKVDVTWHSNLLLDVRRTGDGQCNQADYSISGGISYINITDTDIEFFRGRIRGQGSWFFTYFRAWDIPVQYRVRGVSATLPSQIYTTTIYYTIRDQ